MKSELLMQASISRKIKRLILLALLGSLPLWGQHGAHTHGEAVLNLVLNSDRELVAELIAPAESVYGFEHSPRNAEEKEQMKRGMARLKTALPSVLLLEKAGCKVTEVHGGDTGHKKHDHHHHGHGEEEESSHHNVTIRWSIQCTSDLAGMDVVVDWSKALSDIHRVEVTLLTQDRQEGMSLKRSGSKIRL